MCGGFHRSLINPSYFTGFAPLSHNNAILKEVKKETTQFVPDKEVGNKIIFLRKLAPGGSTHSFGIHVAKMAGMPPELIKRANEILKQLENNI